MPKQQNMEYANTMDIVHHDNGSRWFRMLQELDATGGTVSKKGEGTSWTEWSSFWTSNRLFITDDQGRQHQFTGTIFTPRTDLATPKRKPVQSKTVNVEGIDDAKRAAIDKILNGTK